MKPFFKFEISNFIRDILGELEVFLQIILGSKILAEVYFRLHNKHMPSTSIFLDLWQTSVPISFTSIDHVQITCSWTRRFMRDHTSVHKFFIGRAL